jgi:uncharacterized protein (TIGR00369 family)
MLGSLDTAAVQEVLHDPIRRNPFFGLIGLKLVQAASGHAHYTLDERQELWNGFEVAHGGVIMTILDAAMASAAMSKVDFAKVVVTIDMSVSFLRPGAGRLHAHGRAIGGGVSVCFCEGEILDEDGAVVAKAIGSFKYRQRKARGAAS